MTPPAVLARVARVVEAADNLAENDFMVANDVRGEGLRLALSAVRGQPVTPAEVEEVATWLAGVAQHDILEDRILWEYAARALLTALGLSVARAKGERRVA